MEINEKRDINIDGINAAKNLMIGMGISEYKKEKGMSKDRQQTSDEWKEMIIKKDEDKVNHPKHYTFGKLEVIDVLEDWQLDFCLGNTIKYIARAKHKGHELEDLKKAQWYLNRKISKLEKG